MLPRPFLLNYSSAKQNQGSLRNIFSRMNRVYRVACQTVLFSSVDKKPKLDLN